MDGFRRSRLYSATASKGVQAAQCDGKQAFNEKAARMVAKKQEKKLVSPYKCPFCKMWHIGRLHDQKR